VRRLGPIRCQPPTSANPGRRALLLSSPCRACPPRPPSTEMYQEARLHLGRPNGSASPFASWPRERREDGRSSVHLYFGHSSTLAPPL
jgi:hypothetical protein